MEEQHTIGDVLDWRLGLVILAIIAAETLLVQMGIFAWKHRQNRSRDA